MQKSYKTVIVICVFSLALVSYADTAFQLGSYDPDRQGPVQTIFKFGYDSISTDFGRKDIATTSIPAGYLYNKLIVAPAQVNIPNFNKEILYLCTPSTSDKCKLRWSQLSTDTITFNRKYNADLNKGLIVIPTEIDGKLFLITAEPGDTCMKLWVVDTGLYDKGEGPLKASIYQIIYTKNNQRIWGLDKIDVSSFTQFNRDHEAKNVHPALVIISGSNAYTLEDYERVANRITLGELVWSAGAISFVENQTIDLPCNPIRFDLSSVYSTGEWHYGSYMTGSYMTSVHPGGFPAYFRMEVYPRFKFSSSSNVTLDISYKIGYNRIYVSDKHIYFDVTDRVYIKQEDGVDNVYTYRWQLGANTQNYTRSILQIHVREFANNAEGLRLYGVDDYLYIQAIGHDLKAWGWQFNGVTQEMSADARRVARYEKSALVSRFINMHLPQVNPSLKPEDMRRQLNNENARIMVLVYGVPPYACSNIEIDYPWISFNKIIVNNGDSSASVGMKMEEETGMKIATKFTNFSVLSTEMAEYTNTKGMKTTYTRQLSEKLERTKDQLHSDYGQVGVVYYTKDQPYVKDVYELKPIKSAYSTPYPMLFIDNEYKETHIISPLFIYKDQIIPTDKPFYASYFNITDPTKVIGQWDDYGHLVWSKNDYSAFTDGLPSRLSSSFVVDTPKEQTQILREMFEERANQDQSNFSRLVEAIRQWDPNKSETEYISPVFFKRGSDDVVQINWGPAYALNAKINWSVSFMSEQYQTKQVSSSLGLRVIIDPQMGVQPALDLRITHTDSNVNTLSKGEGDAISLSIPMNIYIGNKQGVVYMGWVSPIKYKNYLINKGERITEESRPNFIPKYAWENNNEFLLIIPILTLTMD